MPEEPPSSSRRPGDTPPPTSRAELRYPPGAYYRRIALGTVLPGAGLLGTRWKVAGWLLVIASLAAGAWVLVRAYEGGLLRSALNVAVQPELLQWVGVGIMVGAVLWVGSIVLTAEQSWPRRRRSGRWARVLFAAAACTVIAAPSALAVRYLDVQSSVIDQVFVTDSPGERRDVALADTAAKDPWADVPRVNTLLIGSDAGKDRWGTRTDSMMVVSTNTKTGDTLLIGIPRNLERVPFPESNPLHALYPNGYDCGDECLMNGIWTLAEGRPDLFPGVKNPGRQSTVDVVGRDHRPRDQPVGRHQPAWASRHSSTRWAGSTSTCSSGSASSATRAPRAGWSSPVTRRSGSSRGCSTSTAAWRSGTPARGPAATTSAGCAASAASPVP